jgi:hypothetical protein
MLTNLQVCIKTRNTLRVANRKFYSGPISAVAARRSRQQAQQTAPGLATTASHTSTDTEPPSKKIKPSPKRSGKWTGNAHHTGLNSLPFSKGESQTLGSCPSTPAAPEVGIQAELDEAEESGRYTDNSNDGEEEQLGDDGANGRKYEPRPH